MCRVPQAGGQEAWYSFNDEQVTRVGASQARSAGARCARRALPAPCQRPASLLPFPHARRSAPLPVQRPCAHCATTVRPPSPSLPSLALAASPSLLQVVSQYAYILFYVRSRSSTAAHHRRNHSAASAGAGGGQ